MFKRLRTVRAYFSQPMPAFGRMVAIAGAFAGLVTMVEPEKGNAAGAIAIAIAAFVITSQAPQNDQGAR